MARPRKPAILGMGRQELTFISTYSMLKGHGSGGPREAQESYPRGKEILVFTCATMGRGKRPKMQSRGHTCNIERVSRLYVLTFGRFRFDRSLVPKKLLFEFNLVVAGQTQPNYPILRLNCRQCSKFIGFGSEIFEITGSVHFAGPSQFEDYPSGPGPSTTSVEYPLTTPNGLPSINLKILQLEEKIRLSRQLAPMFCCVFGWALTRPDQVPHFHVNRP